MADMTDEELNGYIQRGRAIAVRVGMMHAQWDTIMDAEAILHGQPSLLPRDEVEHMLREWLDHDERQP